MSERFKAIVVREVEPGVFNKSIEERNIEDLPANEVLIKVAYAGLNYKDALSASGHKGVTRNFPHTPGVDASGVVVSDKSNTFTPGDRVICTSYDLGMNTDGGFAEYIRVPAAWVVRLPEGMSLKSAMILGTAAYTAALAIYKMEKCGQHPSMGSIVVTGATGGVGSMAVALLKKAGYRVIASSGKADAHDYLKSIGADEIVDREATNDTSGRPLLRAQWAGAIDNVGGNTLATLIKACGRNGSVATIGLVAAPDLNLTVYPFILNGVNLLGIDSAETPAPVRQQIWDLLASDWKLEGLEKMSTMVILDEIPHQMDLILQGKTQGRVVAEILVVE